MEIDVSVSCSECGTNLPDSDVSTGHHGIEVSAAMCENCLDKLKEEAITDLEKEIEDLKDQLKLAVEKNLKSAEDVKTAQDLLEV